MPTTIPADRTMSWRDAQIALLGRDEFNKQEYQKRKARLERRKAAANANRTEHKEEYKQELPSCDLYIFERSHKHDDLIQSTSKMKHFGTQQFV